jgi:hypothetical protein
MKKPKCNTEEYYVLVEDCKPYGPYHTQAKAEQSIIDRNIEAFGGACRCLQQDADSWSEEVSTIVKVVRRVRADIKYTVSIKDA